MMERAAQRDEGENERRSVHPLMYIPVPWVFVLAFLIGAGVQRAAPLHLLPERAPWLTPAGAILMVLGGALAAWCLALFRAERTTTTPGEVSRRLVTWGPYRVSRNPMYVSLTLFYLGEAALLRQPGAVATLLAVLWYVQRTVIPVEEARLRAVFGAVYAAYADRVRRWL